MPWLREATKDGASSDMLRGGAEQPAIRRFPNGETRPDELRSLTRKGGEPNVPK